MNKYKDLISVIVPIYNVEQYLDRCIESILNQTYKNLEIILVDDGSTDNCPKICDRWTKKDNRIKVIHKKNGGISSTRNAGLDISTGKFIGFVDGDDSIDETMYEILYKNLIDTNSDISICSMQKIFNYDEINKLNKNNKIINNKTFVSINKFDGLFDDKIKDTIVAWNKLYKKEIFNELRYPINKQNEDTFLIIKILDKSKKIVYTNLKLYYYFQRIDSIMNSKFNIKKLDELQAFKEQMLFFKREEYINTKYYKLSLLKYADKTIIYYCKLKKFNKENNYTKKIKEIKDDYNEYYKEIINTKINTKKKIKYFIFKYMPNLIYYLKKITGSDIYENK